MGESDTGMRTASNWIKPNCALQNARKFAECTTANFDMSWCILPTFWICKIQGRPTAKIDTNALKFDRKWTRNGIKTNLGHKMVQLLGKTNDARNQNWFPNWSKFQEKLWFTFNFKPLSAILRIFCLIQADRFGLRQNLTSVGKLDSEVSLKVPKL